MVKIIWRNLFESGADVICHQVNCKGVMDNGIAKQVKERYPSVNEAYIGFCEAAKYSRTALLGNILDVSVSLENRDFIVCNLFGQDNYGSGFCFTDYTALRAALEKVKERHGDKSIAMAYRMSSSLAGGDWRIVEEIILDVLGGCDVTLCRYKPNDK